MTPPALPRRLAAESLGAFVLVGGGTGAIAVDAQTGGALGVSGVAVAFGLAVGIMVLAVGHLSGAHLNPAVTLAFAAARHFPAREVAPYVAAQAAGAIAASACVLALLGDGGGLGVTRPGLVGDGGAIATEAALTAVLMIVILAVATDTRAAGHMAAVAIGGTIALEALVFGPVTGASMNPARSLAPAVVSGDLAGLWIYLSGPVAGALAGAAVYQWLRGAPRPAPAAAPDAEETSA